MHAMDLANQVDYAVGSVTVSGFEKIVEINPQHTDYVILAVSGYNGAYNNADMEIIGRNTEYGNRPDGNPYVNPVNVCPARIYIGIKGKMEDGEYKTSIIPSLMCPSSSSISTFSSLTFVLFLFCTTMSGSDAPEDDYLARNGFRYGKVYGFATDMSASGPTGGLFRDAFHKPRDNGSKVDGKFVAIDWMWDGEVRNFRHDGAWDFQLDVPGYAGTDMMWWNANGYDASGSKTEHLSPDTRPGITGFIQGSTAGYFGHYYIHDVMAALDAADGGLPHELDSTYYVYQGEQDITAQINLNGDGLYNIVPECPGAEDATVNCDRDYSVKSTFEDIDGLEIIAAAEGLYAVIQEDSGNDLGERMFISSALEHEMDGQEITYNFMAMSGGKYNTRMAAMVGVPATSSGGGGSHEFSGVIDLSGMLAMKGKKSKKARTLKGKKDKKGKKSSFKIKAHDGAAKRMAEHEVPINEKLIALGLQSHNLQSGVVSALKADRGGQVLLYQPDI